MTQLHREVHTQTAPSGPHMRPPTQLPTCLGEAGSRLEAQARICFPRSPEAVTSGKTVPISHLQLALPSPFSSPHSPPPPAAPRPTVPLLTPLHSCRGGGSSSASSGSCSAPHPGRPDSPPRVQRPGGHVTQPPTTPAPPRGIGRATLGVSLISTQPQSPGPWTGPRPALEGPQCSTLWHTSTGGSETTISSE